MIDRDYRGNVKILLVNNSDTVFEIKEGDRVAQLILKCIQTPSATTIESLSKTNRGDQGFGSTGINEEGQLILNRKTILALRKEKDNVAESNWTQEIITAGSKDETWMGIKTALESGHFFFFFF